MTNTETLSSKICGRKYSSKLCFQPSNLEPQAHIVEAPGHPQCIRSCSLDSQRMVVFHYMFHHVEKSWVTQSCLTQPCLIMGSFWLITLIFLFPRRQNKKCCPNIDGSSHTIHSFINLKTWVTYSRFPLPSSSQSLSSIVSTRIYF